jgi:hypothetical protein
MKKLIISLLAAGLVSCTTATPGTSGREATATGTPARVEAAPKTLMHVVTVQWKAGTTPDQIQAALDAAHKLPAAFNGILRVWTKTVKAQGNRTHVIAMEFASEQALKDYAGSAAQKEWYAVYQPVREASTTFDVTN